MFNPYGSSQFLFDPNTNTPIGQINELSPEYQAIFDAQTAAQQGLADQTNQFLSGLPQGQFDFGQYTSQVQAPGAGVDYGLPDQPFSLDVPDTSDIADTYFNQQMGLMNPQFEDQMSDFELRMSERGLPVGSEVFNDTLGDITREQGLATQQAADQAQMRALQEQQRQIGNQFGVRGQNVQEAGLRGQEQGQEFGQQMQAGQFGISEQQRALANALSERGLPFQELSNVMGMQSGVPQVQGAPVPQSQIANTDVAGNIWNAYNAEQQQANAANQGLFGLASAIGGPLIGMLSDERTKENRKPADGEVILAKFRDMPVDKFDYKPEARAVFDVPESRVGPMAGDWQERFGGDGSTIDLPDMMGRILASLQALDARTQDRARA